jgi:hypothetical protein
MRIDEAYTHLNIIRDYIPEGNSNRPGTKLSPSMITIHNTDNDQRGPMRQRTQSIRKVRTQGDARSPGTSLSMMDRFIRVCRSMRSAGMQDLTLVMRPV